METKESFMLDACTDCAMAVANGTRDVMENLEYHTSEEYAREWFDNFTKASDRWFSKGYVLVNGSEEDDTTFSWSSCDVCGSHLGGSRMSVVAIPM
jgi:hypothetical protein